ncbi:hypothetical protein [Paeniglutamicibacter sp.]
MERRDDDAAGRVVAPQDEEASGAAKTLRFGLQRQDPPGLRIH